MKLLYSFSKNLLFFMAPVSFLLLASCGSYQYSGYENDGIYGEASRVNEGQDQNATQDSNGGYYKNLFAEEAALYGDVLDDNSIFTDVESYSSTGEYEPGDNQYAYAGGNAPWGEDPDSYSINIYNNGFNGLYGGFYNPYWGGGIYAYDPFWGPGYYGSGFYGGGMWGSPWNIGFGGFYPSYGFGYGFAAHPFFYGGGGYYNPYNFYGNRFNHFRQDIAYNSGRRDAVSSFRSRTGESLSRNATYSDSRGRTSSYSRSIRNLRNSDDNSYRNTGRSVTRQYNTNRNTDYSNSNNRSRTINSRTSRSNNTYSRPARTQTRSTNTVRSSSVNRSSGTVRSSGGGGRSSSGGASRGRGN